MGNQIVLRACLAAALIVGALGYLGAGGVAPNGPPDKESVVFVHYPKGFGPPEDPRPSSPGGGRCPSRTFARWSDLTKAVTFVVDTAGSGVPGTAAFDGVVNAVREWDASSGLPAPSPGLFSGLPSSYSGQSNNVNEVAWAPLSTLGYANAIAVTWTWRFISTKEAVEWDMVLNNDPGFEWAQNDLGGADPNTATVSTGKYDVQNVATHEAGHSFGLDHVREPDHTMYVFGSRDEVKKRSLECGDQAGIQKLYGAG